MEFKTIFRSSVSLRIECGATQQRTAQKENILLKLLCFRINSPLPRKIEMNRYLPHLLRSNSVFKNFLLASTVSMLGSNVFDVAIPVYVAAKTGSVYALAAATVALHLPFFLMAPITGYLVDNFNKRKIMLYSDLGQVVCLFLFIPYDFMRVQALWPLLLTVFVAKTLMILFETVATFQLIPALVSKRELSQANAWFLSSQRLIQILGPLVAGILMASVGITSCIVFNIVSFSATLYFVLKMRNLNALLGEERPSNHWRTVTLGDIASNFTGSFKFIWSSSIFKPFVVMMFLWNFSSINPNHPTITHYFMILRGFGAQEFTHVLTLIGTMGIIGFVMSGKVYQRFGFFRSFVGGTLWMAVFSVSSLIFFKNPVALALGVSLSKIGSSLLSMGTFYLRQTHIPRAQMGGINACLRMLFMSATPISCFIQPVLVEYLGSFWSFFFGFLCLGGTAYLAIKVARAYQQDVVETTASKSKAAA